MSKPDILVPGAHIVSDLAPGSDFASLCPDCIRDGEYFQVGGTSMAAGIASGAAADLIDAHPDWTPDQVKGALVKTQRDVAGARSEVNLQAAIDAGPRKQNANGGLTPSTLIDPATGSIDPTRASWTRASWTRASWTDAADPLRASWTRASWTCSCGGNLGGTVDPTRASWTRASWTTSFEK